MPLEALTRNEVLELSGSLVELVGAGRRIANIVIGRPPPEGSEAADDLAHAINANSDNGGPVRRAHEGMLFATLAGWDHVRAVGNLLRSNHPITVATATTTRGAVEAFSRTHWMLDAGTTPELVRRQLSIAIGDLEFYLKHTPDEPLRTVTGREINAPELRETLLGFLAHHGLSQLSTKPTILAREFLDAALGGGALKYSRLSSVAHGESYSVHSFVDLDHLDENLVGLKLPRNIAIEYAGYLVVGGALIGNRLIDVFEPPLDERERWHAAKQRAIDRFQVIDRTRIPAP